MTLRERRKTETNQLIRETALSLARDKGVESVTVEGICEAVGISPRTFFNYFPFKEAVFVMPFPPLPQAAVERFVTSSGDIMLDLVDLMVAQAEEIGGVRWDGDLLFRIAQAHPRLMPLQVAEFQKFDSQLRELVSQRLNGDSDDIQSHVLASAIVGANRPVMDRWRETEGISLPEFVRKSLTDFIRAVRASAPDRMVSVEARSARRSPRKRIT